MRVWLENAYSSPFCGLKWRNRNFMQFYFFRNAITLDWRFMNQIVSKSLLWFSLGTWAQIGVTKIRESNISPIWRDAPTRATYLNFGMRGYIADIVTRAKFCDHRFRGFGILIPLILPFSIGLAGHSYNSVSTAVLQWSLSFTLKLSRTNLARHCNATENNHHLPRKN